MTENRGDGWRRAIVAAVFAILATAFPARGQVEKVGEIESPSPVELFTRTAEECRICHGFPKNFEQARKDYNLICRMDEWTTWESQDPHRNAYAALLSPRGQEMGKVLSNQLPSGQRFDVTKEHACLNCHSTPVDGVDPSFVDQLGNGVSCVVCHGAGKAWAKDHTVYTDKKWRSLPREVKEAKYGMTDLWDPVRRAETCAACHIGKLNSAHPEQNKLITHAMYAAGHPPLSSFEAATFSDQQPRHWQYLREKDNRIQAEQGFDRSRREQTEQVGASGLVALRAVMALFADEREAQGPSAPRTDYARFDCYSCHHDLRRPSWRQERGYLTAPGRIPAPSWPDALVRVGIEVADPDRASKRTAEYTAKLEAFHKALGAKPFGDRKDVALAARSIVDWADGVIPDLRRTPGQPRHAAIGSDAVVRLLHVLSQQAQDTWDYDANRQLAWAFRVIYTESRQIAPQEIPAPTVPQILESLENPLGLTLRPDKSRQSLEDSLFTRLQRIANYDPESIHEMFSKLDKALPPLPSK